MKASYLDWTPAIRPEEIFQQTVVFTFLSIDEQGQLFWVENRPDEGGRCVLVMKNLNGAIQDVIPVGYSARSRVFEYGGSPYAVAKGWAHFVNFKDQRVYKISLTNLNSQPQALTVEINQDRSLGKYMDLCVSPDGRWLIFAYEKEIQGQEPINQIGIIDLNVNDLQEAKTVVSGADFYKSPVFSPDGLKLSWLEWNHPNMPWDSTLLFEADLNTAKSSIENKIQIAGSETSSISQFCYSSSGEIIFAADFAGQSEASPKNYYNLCSYKKGELNELTNVKFEFRDFRCVGNIIYAWALDAGISKLVSYDLDKKILKNIEVEANSFSVPIPWQKNIFLNASFANLPSQILELSFDGKTKVIKKSTEQVLNPDDISSPIAIKFPTEDGQISYGYFYPPVNSKYQAPQGELPPVRVMVHGGPTGMASPGFLKQKTYWTSQGYAIFDVNYRGSFGFGRAYKDALNKKWGLLEIQDVKDGLAYLKNNSYISNQAVVSGGSAGGYTVQRLLTYFPDLFAAGASHYGIGNLVTLQKLTHKFEAHYLEQLIGGTLETNLKEYEDRSPINHLGKLKSPMIIFQGTEDKAVPPEISQEIADVLKIKKIPFEYHEYQGEGHGFRQKTTLIDVYEKEAQFFKKTLKQN